MKEEAEGCYFQTALKASWAQSAARDRLKYPDGTNVIANSKKDARVSNVQRAGN